MCGYDSLRPSGYTAMVRFALYNILQRPAYLQIIRPGLISVYYSGYCTASFALASLAVSFD